MNQRYEGSPYGNLPRACPPQKPSLLVLGPRRLFFLKLTRMVQLGNLTSNRILEVLVDLD